MAILRAIAGGERDAQKLAQQRDPRCSKTEQEIARTSAEPAAMLAPI
jgi:urease accessory protein UreF